MRNIIYLLFLVLYSILFWQEALGVNLVLFTFIIFSYLRLSKKIALRKSELVVLLALLASSVGLTLYNSTLSIVMFFCASISYAAYLNAGVFSTIEAFLNSFISFFSLRTPLLPDANLKQSKPKQALLYLRIAFLPLLIFIIFFLLFKEGNQIFGQWSEKAFGSFFRYLDYLDFTYFFFVLLGLLIIRWLFKEDRRFLIKLDRSNFLSRKRKSTFSFKNLALKREYISALLLFGMLNALLLIINFIDIKWVWFQFYLPESFSLKDFVHEGVGYLIFSLILSAGLVLYYFRGSLNFYPKSGALKFLAQLWLVQNAILALSVARRTFYYIGFHGLADRRIALLAFIGIILVCLGLLVYKLATKRNNDYLLKQSSAFILIFLCSLSLINWDQRVATFNLNHGQANEIDIDNYLNLSPRVYPYLYENMDRIAFQIKRHQNNEVRWVSVESIEEFKNRLNLKKEAFLVRQSRRTWRSWNYADSRAVQKLKAIES